MARYERVRVVLAIGIVVMLNSLTWGKYGGGSGTPGDPYLIYTADHLKEVGTRRSDWHWEVCYKLMADIDLAGYDKPIGPMGTLDFSFMGDFDGNGKTISNLKIVQASGDNVGLFGHSQARIHDLRLVNVDVSAPQSTCVGALVGYQAGREIERCHVVSGTVSGRNEVGGLVGSNGGVVSQCSTACQVSGANKVGGLVGSYMGPYWVSECYSTAAVTGSADVGGLAGLNRGVLKDCYATGAVHGVFPLGGLAGNCGGDGQIWNCYAAGKVVTNGGTAGGLYGIGTACYSSYWDFGVRGLTSSSDKDGRTTAQMRTAGTFRGWGRTGLWTIAAGADYPRLAWEKKPGTPLTTPAFSNMEGQGTAPSPYLIHTAEELNLIGAFPGEWDKHYRLEADIDLATLAEPYRIIGSGALLFTGVFDGNDHSISNSVCPYAAVGAGLIGCTRDATIRRTILINPRHEADWAASVGTLVGKQWGGTVEDCGVEGGSVASSNFVGGLIGTCDSGIVTRCYSTCAVASRNTGEDIGGLIGRGSRCNITDCYATGGVAGQMNVGGLIGRMEAGNVIHCYSTGRVTGAQSVGGLLGRANGTTVLASFWDVQTSGQAGSAGGRGLSTAEMQIAATFIQTGWDFVGEAKNGTANIWGIAEGKGYPEFSHEPPPASAEGDDFTQDETAPLWQVYEPTPQRVWFERVSGRLELHADRPADLFSALYLSSGWRLDVAQDFSLRINFGFSKIDPNEGWVSLGLAPSLTTPVTRYVDVRAGCEAGESLHLGKLADGFGFGRWVAARGSDVGTLYLSYDANADELYLSFTGYGPANSWHTVAGLLRDRWAGNAVYVVLGGWAKMSLEKGDAWLDNFVVDTGVVLP
jgi:hypothetical protein